jgi:multimeric flavodoxin WrbA
MSIIGFSSGVGRDGNVSRMVRYILEQSGRPHEMVYLPELTYSPCRGCAHLCAKDNLCRLEDDLLEVLPRVASAEALVFGTPTHFGTMNGFMTVLLERMWCFRHQRYVLEGRPYAVVASGGLREPLGAVEAVKKRMTAYHGAFVGGAAYQSGIVPCYKCGYGRTCRLGGAAQLHEAEEQAGLTFGPEMFARWEDSPEFTAELGRLAQRLSAAISG